jgi:hypothetical protein
MYAMVPMAAPGVVSASRAALPPASRVAVPSTRSRAASRLILAIEQLGLAALGDEDVCGLDIAMDDSFRVRGFESVGNLNPEIEKLLGLECAAFDAVLERLAFEQLHGDEWLAIVFANFVYGANIGMIQTRRGASFALEPLESLLIFSYRFRQKFQRHQPPQLGIFGLEDHTHPAAAKLFDDSIVRDFRAGKGIGIRHGGAS